MNKTELIREIREAHRAHVNWITRIYAVLEGMQSYENLASMNTNGNKFGAWYHGHGQIFAGMREFKALKEPYKTLHSAVKALLYALPDASSRSNGLSLQRFLNRTGDTQDLRQHLLPLLQSNSDTLVNKLHTLEQAVQRISDSDMEKLVAEWRRDDPEQPVASRHSISCVHAGRPIRIEANWDRLSSRFDLTVQYRDGDQNFLFNSMTEQTAGAYNMDDYIDTVLNTLGRLEIPLAEETISKMLSTIYYDVNRCEKARHRSPAGSA